MQLIRRLFQEGKEGTFGARLAATLPPAALKFSSIDEAKPLV